MDLILKDNICIDLIELKYSRKCIKLLYNLGYIRLIGLSIRLRNYIPIFSNDYIYITINDPYQLGILNKINEFFEEKSEVQPYESFINDRIIKVKNNKRYNRDSSIYICLNNLKEYQGKYKLQIFTI
tara:strand:- start:277 stop:657 length:381 start_codon:yes stop_codon:yes gene_type:complete